MQEMNHFFEHQRRRLTFTSFTSKKSTEGERRLRLDFEMPLTGEPKTDMPDTILAAYELLDENAEISSRIGLADIKGQRLTLFHLPAKVVGRPQETTPKLELPSVDLNAAYVFRVVQEERENPDVRLSFTATTALSKEVLDWARHNLGATVYGEFETVQPTLTDGKAAAAGKDPDNDDGEENFIEEPAPTKSDPSLAVTKRKGKRQLQGVH